MADKLKCMDTIPQGVFIVGTKKEEGVNLMTAAFVTQVSFAPPSIAVSIDNSRYTAELIKKEGRFSLSVLAEGQTLPARYCGFQSGRDADKAARVSFWLTEQGLPVVDGAAAWMACKVHKAVVYEDHTLFIAEIEDGDTSGAGSMIYESEVFFPGK